MQRRNKKVIEYEEFFDNERVNSGFIINVNDYMRVHRFPLILINSGEGE